MTLSNEVFTGDNSAFQISQPDNDQITNEELKKEKDRELFRIAKEIVVDHGHEEQITIGTFQLDSPTEGMTPTKVTRLATPSVKATIDTVISAFSISNGDPVVYARVVEAKAGWPNWDVENDGYVLEVGPGKGRKVPIFHITDPDASRLHPSTNVFGSRVAPSEIESAFKFLQSIKAEMPNKN